MHLKPCRRPAVSDMCLSKPTRHYPSLPDDAFPVWPSHLAGQEFWLNAVIHNGKIEFMNITEYVHLGYSQIVPETPAQ
ncbi:MAG: hypothetical protein R3B74_01155 [Nitrospirales bacterium]|nr:hypothetical protein [Nitrospirales bacterium]